MNATIKLEKKHFPVLLNELISIISPLYGGTFIDCTLGQGGYSKKILENHKNKVIALDRDNNASVVATKIKKQFNKRFQFINTTFSQIDKINLSNDNIKAIIFDLGFSTYQINDPTKGLSFKSTGKLNMKMGFNDFSAHEVINNLSEKHLNKMFKYFGEESMSKSIARKIISERKKKLINTKDLVTIVDKIKGFKKKKIHNSTKVFQSLRIFVNKEISELIYGLINSFKILPIGGTIVVVTFHSLEDKIVKFFFRNYSEDKNFSRYLPEKIKKKQLFNMIKKKPIIPSKSELEINPPSRSAKLRYAVKKNNTDDFSVFINQFKYLTDIEKLSSEL